MQISIRNLVLSTCGLFFAGLALADRIADGTFVSPDKKVTATIVTSPDSSRNEFEVFFSSLSHPRLASASYLSQGADPQGRSLVHAQWTSDGQFFVMSTTSSGGHSPWHQTTYYFSRATRAIRELDFELNGSVTGDFTVGAGVDSTITLDFAAEGQPSDQAASTTIDLSKVEAKNSSWGED